MVEVALWQFRWTNPGDQQDEWSLAEAKKWRAVEHPHWQPLEMRLLELREARFNGKPCYEVRSLGVITDGVLATDGLSNQDAIDAQRWRWIRRNVVRMEDYAFSVDDDVEAFVDAMIAQGLQEARL